MLDETREHLATLRPTDVISRGTASHVTPSAAQAAPAAPDEAQARPVRKLSERWYVIRHKPFEGDKARIAIRRLGFEVHWPRAVVRRARRNDTIEPIFPGYLFARFDVSRGTYGAICGKKDGPIIGIVGMQEDGRPIPVPPGVVERLIARAGAIDLPIMPPEDDEDAVVPLEPGDEVELLDPSWMGRRGLLKADRGGERVKVLLSILGVVDCVVEVQRGLVRKVGAA